MHILFGYVLLLAFVTAVARTSDCKPRIESIRHWIKAAFRLGFVVLILSLIGLAIGVHPLLPIGVIAVAVLASFGILALPVLLVFQWIIVPPKQNFVDSSGITDYREKKEAAAKLTGSTGVALTDLKPFGSVEIDGQSWIATTESGMIQVDQNIRVVGQEKTFLIVTSENK